MYSGYSIPIKSSLSYIQCTFPGLSSQHVELCHKGLVECTLFLCINSWLLIKSIQKFAEVDRMLRLRNHFPLELCRKKKNYIKIHTYRGKRVKHSELAWCQHYKKGWKKKKKDKKAYLCLWEQIFVLSLQWRKICHFLGKRICAQWGKAVWHRGQMVKPVPCKSFLKGK